MIRSMPASTLLTCLISVSALAEEEISFSGDIRPILSDKCFQCHGPEDVHREGGFRFDQIESALGEADSGEIPIVPGNPEQSELVARVTSHVDGIQMPPAEANKSLTEKEIQLLVQWIKEGAEWEGHWSLVPPQKSAPPQVKQSDWAVNEIDDFILSRLEKSKLTPNGEADRATLIRRVTLDLTGLPPTPEEVRSFLADDSPDAFAKVVDRLLASDRFGENQSRYWLDAARYGDTHGLHLDNYREMWPYRDWVIRAFNQNQPFDQFIVEQLGGDLLPNPTRDQLIATGFNRAHVTTNEGGSIKEEVHVRNVVDRVVTFGTVFMGATFECTRCHDHKFDPFTMNDFYSLYAYFNSIDGNPMDGNKKDHEPILKVSTKEQQARLKELDQDISILAKKVNQKWPELEDAQAVWEREITSSDFSETLDWTTLDPASFTSSGGAELQLLEDQSILVGGKNPARDVYTITSTISGADWQGIRLEALLHESLTNGGAGRSPNSNVVLTEFEVYTAPDSEDPDDTMWTRVELVNASADHEQGNGDFKISNAIDGNAKTGWAIEGHAKKEPRTALFQAKEKFGSEEQTLLKIVLKQESIYKHHQFGRIRLSVTKQQPIRTDVPEDILKIAEILPKERTQKQRQTIRKHFRDEVSDNPEYIQARDALAAKRKERDEFDQTIPTTLIWKELAEPKPAHILTRGEYDQPGAQTSRHTPISLPPMPEGSPNDRLGLAKWLIDRQHPLTARVAVNRFWQQFFGIGLVKTSEDFGSQGEPPSHPLLLDWMAVQFIDDGWDVKKTIKRIVMSATYRQSSKIDPEKLQKDPANRLLARGPRFRLDAEVVRDQALFVSGLLVEQLGGPSVKPPQPDGLWFAVGYSGSNTVRFVPDEGADKIHRRTVYTFIKRTSPPPQMNVFDAPSRESCTVRRERTNTPMQALLLFNDPQYVEAAIALAQSCLEEAGDSPRDVARVMLWRTLCREPSETEIDSLAAGFEMDFATFQDDPKAAEQLLTIASFPIKEDCNQAKLAAWSLAGNLLLNLDEVVTKN